jgi:hypothetical protein
MQISRTLICAAAAAAAVAGASLLIACSPEKSLNAPTGSIITEITPEVGKPLTVEVKLQVSAAYALTAESGTLGLIVQDAKSTPVAQVENGFQRWRNREARGLVQGSRYQRGSHIHTSFRTGQVATATLATRSYRVKSR